jgi:hypothetical protein
MPALRGVRASMRHAGTAEMKPTAHIPVWTERERKACCALGRLEQDRRQCRRGRRRGAAVSGGRGLCHGRQLAQPPFGCSDQILPHRVGLAHLGEHGLRWECHGPHKQLGVVLMANPDGVRALTRR